MPEIIIQFSILLILSFMTICYAGKWKVIFWLSIFIVATYLLLRLFSFKTLDIWVDQIFITVLAFTVSYLISRKFKEKGNLKTYIYKGLTSVLVAFVFTAFFIITGIITHGDWFYNIRTFYRTETECGALVAIHSADAGGLAYTEVSMRNEILWGYMYKELDERRLYDDHTKVCETDLKCTKECDINLKCKEGHTFSLNYCTLIKKKNRYNNRIKQGLKEFFAIELQKRYFASIEKRQRS